MSKKYLLMSVLVLLVVCLIVGIKFMNGDSSSSRRDEEVAGVIAQPVESIKESAIKEASIENIEDFVEHEAHIRFVGNGYIYIVDDHDGTYLSTKDITSGGNSIVHRLPEEFRGGVDYLANSVTYSYFYIIFDTYYYEAKYLDKDMYKKFTLHRKFQDGDYYFTANGYFYMITSDKMSVRRTTNLNTAADYSEFDLPEEVRDGDDYFGWKHRYYVVDLASDTVRSYANLETLEDPQADAYSESILDYLPYRNYTGYWEQVWDSEDVTSQQEITTTYRFGVEYSADGGATYQPANPDEAKRAKAHFYLSKMGKSLPTASEIWVPVQEEQQNESIDPGQHITKWQWVITYDNYRQSKQHKVYTKIFKQTQGETPNIPLNSTLNIPPVTALPKGKPENGTVQLSWHTAHEKDSFQLFEYQIYRSEFKDGDRTLLTEKAIGGNTYVDSTVEDEQIYYYWVRTVNNKGVMSPYSEPSEPVYVDTKNKIAFLSTGDTIKSPEADEEASQSDSGSDSEMVEGPVSVVVSDGVYGNDGVDIFKLFQSNADGSNQELVVGGHVRAYSYSPDGHRIAYTAKNIRNGRFELGFKDVNAKILEPRNLWPIGDYGRNSQFSNLSWNTDQLLNFLFNGQLMSYTFFQNNGFGNLGNLDIYSLISRDNRTRQSYYVKYKYNQESKKAQTVIEKGVYKSPQDSLPTIDDNVQNDTTMTASFYKELLFYTAKKDGDYDIYGYGSPYDFPEEHFTGTVNDVDDRFPVLSPDGTKVAYLSKVKPGNWALCVMDVAYEHKNDRGHNVGTSTLNQRVLVENIEYAEPVWMPNSKTIIYSAKKPVLGKSYSTSESDTYLYLYSLDHQESVQISQENKKNKLPQVVPLRYEAEDALIQNAAIQLNEQASNSYVVGDIKTQDSYVEFTVNVPVEHISYRVYVGYFMAKAGESSHWIELENRPPFEVIYDNEVQDQLQVQEVSVPLKAGENKIRFRFRGENIVDIDYITVLGHAEK